METKITQMPVSTTTANLLHTLRLIEQARECYFRALLGAEPNPDDVMPREATEPFTAVYRMVECHLCDQVNDWANSATEATPL